jgi:hypothetical protein
MIRLNGHMIKLKYCKTCKVLFIKHSFIGEMYRPPRTIHCDDCGVCIEKLDHHCPWVGTCVGKRNYRYFLSFVNALAVLITFMMVCSIWNLNKMAHDIQDDLASQNVPLTSSFSFSGIHFFYRSLGISHRIVSI